MEKEWFGHPRGLATLFFTEMWERFSYYGMRALLVLYMVAPLEKGGLGFATEKATSIYGWYTMLVYVTCIAGGYAADKWIGQYRSVLWGGIIIAAGHFSMAIDSINTFYLGLALIVVGTGLLKPNISTLVGSLYTQEDNRRDAGFSVFYMGINIGAMIAPIITGFLGQKYNWHYGFGAAGVGMALGIVQYVMGKDHLLGSLKRIEKSQIAGGINGSVVEFTEKEKKGMLAIMVFFSFSMLFWSAFEQAGSSLNLFADRYTELKLFGWEIPSSWFQSINSIFVITLAPVFSLIWIGMGKREPTSPVKFALGLIFVGLGFLLLVPASAMAQAGTKVSPMWLVGVYLLHTIGELCLSPVGLSTVTKLAPPRMVGAMMGVWFVSISFGNKLGGWVAGFFEKLPLTQLFGAVFGTTAVAAIILLVMTPWIKKLTYNR